MNAATGIEPTIISLGCRMNIAESEQMRVMLRSAAAAAATGENAGNLVVINSCAVTNEALRQTRQAIRRARADHPGARLMVTGCASEIERAAIGAMDEVDGIIANAAKLDPRAWNLPARDAPLVADGAMERTRAFIAVQNGCDHACTFCIIPKGRGASRSLSIAEVLREVAAHMAAGAKEIVLTGVDLTSWGQDISNTPRLGALINAILHEFDQLGRLRLSSVDGVEIDAELFDLLAHEPRVMPHLHLSLQHGADLILKRMKRRHLRRDALELVARLKVLRPGIAIGADLIAGFPTESARHHADNLAIIRDLDIVHGHIFPYSPRPGTPAARMPQVERAVVKSRAAQLRAAVAAQRAAWLQSLIGQPLSILAERDGTGYAPNYARARLPAGTPAGTLAQITATKIEEGLLK